MATTSETRFAGYSDDFYFSNDFLTHKFGCSCNDCFIAYEVFSDDEDNSWEDLDIDGPLPQPQGTIDCVIDIPEEMEWDYYQPISTHYPNPNPNPDYFSLTIDDCDFSEDEEEYWWDTYPEPQGQGSSAPRGGNNAMEKNSGTINVTYYMQSYNGSVDMSALSNGNTGSSDPPKSQLSTLAEAAATVLPAFLADPTTEEVMGMPDRLETHSAGMTSIQTQSSVGLMRGYNKVSDSGDPTSCADRPTTTMPSTSRFYTIDVGYWIANTVPGTGIRILLPAGLEQAGMYGQNIKHHYLNKSGWKVQVQCNASKFHAGTLGVFMVPEFPSGGAFTKDENFGEVLGETNYNQMFLYPHQIINLRTNTSATVEVPYVNLAPMSTSDIHWPWCLLVVCLSPLRYSTGAATTVKITATVQPIEPTFCGLRQSATAQGWPVRLTRDSTSFGTTDIQERMPSYPLVYAPFSSYMAGEMENFITACRVPCLCSLKKGTARDNDVGYFSATNTFSTEPLLSFNVALSDPTFLNTYVGSMSRSFTNYRGTLNLDFMFAGSSMTNGKFVVAYTPPGAGAPTTVEDAMQGTYIVWDIGVQSTLNFPVPFISVSDYRWCDGGPSTTVNIDGWITVFQLTTLTYPANNPTSSDILLFASAGKDFAFRFPRDNVVNIQGNTNLETGQGEDTVPNQFDAHPLKNYFGHTDVNYVMQRSFFCDTHVLMNTRLATSEFPFRLTHRLTNYAAQTNSVCASNKTLQWWWNLFTYYRCDLEVSLQVVGGTAGSLKPAVLYAQYIPPGASAIPDPTTHAATLNPPALVNQGMYPTYTVSAVNNAEISFKIPYPSVLSFLSTSFSGYGDFAKTAWGTPPASSLGSVVTWATFAQNNTGDSIVYNLFIKFVNFKGYCPRPIKRRAIPATTREVTRDEGIEDARNFAAWNDQIEEPEIRPQGVADSSQEAYSKALTNEPFVSFRSPVNVFFCKNRQTYLSILRSHYSRFYRRRREIRPQGLFDIFSNFTEAADSVRNAAKDFQSAVKSTQKNLATTVSATRVLKVVTKFLMSCLIIIRCNYDPVISAMLAAMFAIDLTSPFSIFLSIKEVLASSLHSTPPEDIPMESFFAPSATPTPQGPTMRDLATALNVGKGIEWAYGVVIKIIDWIKSWLEKEKTTPASLFDETMLTLDVHMETASDMLIHPNDYTWEEMVSTAGELSEAYKRAMMIQKTSVASMVDRKHQELQRIIKKTYGDPDSRPEPICISLYGGPGCGKSLLATIIARSVSKKMDGESTVYSKPPDSDFFDGYAQQYSVIMDDLGQNPDGKDVSTFCQMISTTTFQPPMAAVDEKGMSYISPFCIATTNHQDLMPVTISDPDAFRRRFYRRLKVEVKRSFTSKGRLDAFRALHPCKHDPDGYEVCVPLLCGFAVDITDMDTKETFTTKTLIEDICEALKTKKSTHSILDKIVPQGLMDDVKAPTAKQSMDMIRLLARTDEGLDELEKMNVITRVACEFERTKRKAVNYKNFAVGIVTVLGTIVSALAFWKIIAYFLSEKPQGPYAAESRAKPAPFRVIEAQGPTVSDFEKAIFKNAIPVDFHGRKILSLTLLGIRERYALMNKHAYESDWDKIVTNGETFTREELKVFHLNFNGNISDCVIVQFPRGKQFKNITGHFPKDYSFTVPSKVTGCMNSNSFPTTFFFGSSARKLKTVKTTIGIMPAVISYTSPTSNGFCGAPVIGTSNGRKLIVGIHCAGDGYTGYCSTISQDTIAKVLPESQGIIEEDPNPMLTKNVHIPRKTKLMKSPLFIDFQPEAGPAVLSQYDPRLEPGVILDEVVLAKHTSDMDTLPEIFTTAAKDYATLVFSKIGKENGKLTYIQAMNGIEGLDPMDMNTSPGYPYNTCGKTRKDLVVVDGESYVPSDELLSDLADLEKNSFRTTFSTFLKDEVRDNCKIVKGKTRIVDASNFPHAIVGRQLFGNFSARYMEENGPELGTAVGCNPDLDFTRFYHDLDKDYVFDLDYSGFDATHPSAIFKILADHFFTKENGFHPDVGPYLKTLSYSHHVMGDRKFFIKGGLPSGCSCTSILNTVINNIVIRAAVMATHQGVDFSDFRMLAYGDDVVYATNQPIKPKTLANYLNKNTTYKVTPASKEGEFPDTSTILDVTFLKRKFVPDKTSSYLIHPAMSETHLKKILSFTTKGHFKEKLASVSTLAYHSGEEVYNDLFAPVWANPALGPSVPSWVYHDHCWKQQFQASLPF